MNSNRSSWISDEFSTQMNHHISGMDMIVCSQEMKSTIPWVNVSYFTHPINPLLSFIPLFTPIFPFYPYFNLVNPYSTSITINFGVKPNPGFGLPGLLKRLLSYWTVVLVRTNRLLIVLMPHLRNSCAGSLFYRINGISGLNQNPCSQERSHVFEGYLLGPWGFWGGIKQTACKNCKTGGSMFGNYPRSYPRDIQKQWKTLWFSNWR